MAARRRMLNPPAWPERDGRARVLVEAWDGALRAAISDSLDPEHHQVIECEGPAPQDGPACPMVEGGRCPTAAHADVVICELTDGDTRRRELPAALTREVRAGVSVIVTVAGPMADQDPEALAGCRVLRQPVRRAELVAAVDAAVAELASSPPPPPVHPPREHWSPPHLS